MLSNEQIQKIKTHLLDQLVNFPEDQRKFMKHKILSMTNVEVEEFLKKNQLAHLEDPSSQAIQSQPSCIFCSIVAGKIPSYKIYEDKHAIGILEINPISKGHALLVPKNHLKIEEINESLLNSAEKIAKHIQEEYSPQELKVEKNNILGHSLIEIIPIYGDETEREKADPKDLEKMKSELTMTSTITPEKEIQKTSKTPQETQKEMPVQEKIELVKLKPRRP